MYSCFIALFIHWNVKSVNSNTILASVLVWLSKLYRSTWSACVHTCAKSARQKASSHEYESCSIFSQEFKREKWWQTLFPHQSWASVSSCMWMWVESTFLCVCAQTPVRKDVDGWLPVKEDACDKHRPLWLAAVLIWESCLMTGNWSWLNLWENCVCLGDYLCTVTHHRGGKNSVKLNPMANYSNNNYKII